MNNRADPMLADPLKTPLQDLDVSDPRRFEQDCWQPLFKRLREESPVHFQAESPAGPFGRLPGLTTLSKSKEHRDFLFRAHHRHHRSAA